MGRTIIKATVLSCIFFLLFGTISYAQNLERIFNSGINFGWLTIAAELGMFRNVWSSYAYGGTMEYNNAFSPPRNFKMPRASKDGAQSAIAYIKMQVNYIRGAKSIFTGGAHLGYAHIYAQYGRCSSCLKRTMLVAGRNLKGAGQAIGNQSLFNIGANLEVTAARMDTRRMTVQQVQGFTNMLAGAIAQVQQAL